ncbi:MAG: DUF3291 domain-containing protein [Acidimicrobiales bacterium]
MTTWQLAQLNVGRLRAPVDHPDTAGFADNLDPVNAAAEAAPGFVWRLKDDSGNATGFVRDGDPLRILNLSVWDSIESLKAFTYGDGHVEFMRRRLEWFEPRDRAHLVLWWVPAGHEPSIDEAESRLARLEADGPSPSAFTFARPFPPDADPPR